MRDVAVAAIEVGFLELRVNGDGGGVIGNRLGVLALCAVDVTAIVVGLLALRVNGDSSGVIGNRFGVLALCIVDYATT